MAFALQFSIRSEGAREVEASWPADVVMRVLNFLDSTNGWLAEVQAEAQAASA